MTKGPDRGINIGAQEISQSIEIPITIFHKISSLKIGSQQIHIDESRFRTN